MPEPELLALASAVGIKDPEHSDRLLLVARIEDAIATVTGHNPPKQASQPQMELLRELGCLRVTGLTRREAGATIRVGIAKERLNGLLELRPIRGDRLVCTRARGSTGIGEIVEVSSIDRHGQVWTKQAHGYPARPQDLCRPPS